MKPNMLKYLNIRFSVESQGFQREYRNGLSIICASSKMNHKLQLVFIIDVNLTKKLLLRNKLSLNYIE